MPTRSSSKSLPFSLDRTEQERTERTEQDRAGRTEQNGAGQNVAAQDRTAQDRTVGQNGAGQNSRTKQSRIEQSRTEQSSADASNSDLEPFRFSAAARLGTARIHAWGKPDIDCGQFKNETGNHFFFGAGSRVWTAPSPTSGCSQWPPGPVLSWPAVPNGLRALSCHSPSNLMSAPPVLQTRNVATLQLCSLAILQPGSADAAISQPCNLAAGNCALQPCNPATLQPCCLPTLQPAILQRT